MAKAKIITFLLTKIFGSFVSEEFLAKLIKGLIIEGLKYLKTKNFLKNSEADEKLIQSLIDQLET